MKTYDAIIAGRGIAGLSLALALQRYKYRVLIIARKKRQGEASPAAAGILDPFLGKTAEEPFLKLCAKAFHAYPSFLRQFPVRTVHKKPYLKTGMLLIACTPSEENELKRRFVWQKKYGLKTELLRGGEVLSLEQNLSAQVLSGLYYPQIGRIQPQKLLAEMEKIFLARGGEFVFAKTYPKLLHQKERAVGVQMNGRNYFSPVAVNAMGAWAGHFAGFKMPGDVKPVRGQLVEIRHPDLKLKKTIHTLGDYYIVPWNPGTYIIGSTVEYTGFKGGNTRSAIRDILRQCSQFVPCISQAQVLRAWYGLRPQFAAGQPIIGEGNIRGSYLASGYFRSGILAGGYIGRLLADFISTGKLPAILKPFTF